MEREEIEKLLSEALAPLNKKVRWLRRYCRELEDRLTALEEDLDDRHLGEFLRAFELWRNSPAGREARRKLRLEGRIGMHLEEALVGAFREEWNRPPELTEEERQQLVATLERLELIVDPVPADVRENGDEPPF